MDIQTISTIESASPIQSKKNSLVKFGVAFLFIIIVYIAVSFSHSDIANNNFLIIAAVFGAYMAMNIGANDVANNVGPAVGSNALSMMGAIVIAAIFEASGALIAGGDVVSTIKKGIIDPAMIDNPDIFIWAMSAALLSAALWLNFATYFGAPVSTTHSIVGGVMGGGIAAAGFAIVAWGTIGKIAVSWVISPVLGGLIAALFLYLIKTQIVFKKDKIASAKKMVPILMAIMTIAFFTYILLKGFKKIIKIDFPIALSIGMAVGITVYFLVKPLIANVSKKLKNNRTSVNTLFNIPLIFSAALLSFAHGANDVANAIGPLAAINDAVISGGEFGGKVGIPLWVMAVGAVGIAIGLALYGPKLIKTVGSEITQLDQMRAFSIALAAAITVILASQLGLPVSSTHIAVGGVFGVGFLREYIDNTEANLIKQTKQRFKDDQKELEKFEKEFKKLDKKEDKSKKEYQKVIDLMGKIEELQELVKDDKKEFKQAKKIKYVKRDALKKIAAAWVITVPVAATLSASLFYMIKGFML